MTTNIYVYSIILGYAFVLIMLYFFIVKRLNHLTKKHIEYTKVEGLLYFYNVSRKVILALFVLLFLSSTFIILTFL